MQTTFNGREFLKRVAFASTICGGATYLAWAPEDYPLSLKDFTGTRSRPEPQQFTLPDYRVKSPTGMPEIGIGRTGSAAQMGDKDEALRAGRYSIRISSPMRAFRRRTATQSAATIPIKSGTRCIGGGAQTYGRCGTNRCEWSSICIRPASTPFNSRTRRDPSVCGMHTVRRMEEHHD